MAAAPVEALVHDQERARAAFLAALDDVDPALATAPGLVGEWSARELVAHMGYWCGHAAEALHLASLGRLDDFVDPNFDVDARNATVARVARETDLATVRQREESSYRAFMDLLGRIDPSLLDERVPYGPTLEEVVRENGERHYNEHTDHLRSW